MNLHLPVAESIAVPNEVLFHPRYFNYVANDYVQLRKQGGGVNLDKTEISGTATSGLDGSLWVVRLAGWHPEA